MTEFGLPTYQCSSALVSLPTCPKSILLGLEENGAAQAFAE